MERDSCSAVLILETSVLLPLPLSTHLLFAVILQTFTLKFRLDGFFHFPLPPKLL